MTDQERATAALLAYGHDFDGASYTLKGSTWQPDGNVGFLRFQKSGSAWKPVPYKIGVAWEGVGGLLYEEHPECFDMAYPFAYVANIYEQALIARAAA